MPKELRQKPDRSGSMMLVLPKTTAPPSGIAVMTLGASVTAGLVGVTTCVQSKSLSGPICVTITPRCPKSLLRIPTRPPSGDMSLCVSQPVWVPPPTPRDICWQTWAWSLDAAMKSVRASSVRIVPGFGLENEDAHAPTSLEGMLHQPFHKLSWTRSGTPRGHDAGRYQ